MIHWSVNIKALALLLLSIQITNARRREPKEKHICPIGFTLAHTKHQNDPVCYRPKGPEAFTDKYKDCAGNLYTSKLYHSLHLKTNVPLWTEYKSLYPGGPFIDWSFTESTGDILVTTYDVKYDSNLGLDEELCVVIDSVTNFTAARCDEKNFRYCFVKPFEDSKDDMDKDECGNLDDFWRFWSPTPSCLTAVTGAGGGTVRANQRQANELCAKRNSSLLSHGWRYGNDPLFFLSDNDKPTFPLGMIVEKTRVRYDTIYDNREIPESEWQFDSQNLTDGASVALRDSFWYLVNSSYIFYDVICERPVQLRRLDMNVSVEPEGKLILTVNDTVDENDIYCFSDSVIYYPIQIKVRQQRPGVFSLKAAANGHYWCIHVDSRKFYVSESNRALFIRDKRALINHYAIKIRLKTEYKFETLEDFYRDWRKKLEEYIFYRTKYIKVFGDLELTEDAEATEDTLKTFKKTHPDLKWKNDDLINEIDIKRLYLDGKTALVHVDMNPEMIPVSPGFWDNIEVEFMKPIYYCKGFDSVPTLPLGSGTKAVGCRTHTCVGDFDEGVQWVTTVTEDCTTKHPVTMSRAHEVVETVTNETDLPYTNHHDSSSEEDRPPPNRTTTLRPTELTTVENTETVSTVNPITVEPTTSVPVTAVPPRPTTPRPSTPRPPPPDEQLQQVLDDLTSLVNNDTVEIHVEDIDVAFDQVDSLLEVQDELEIPSELLHLLDKLGARVHLNGSHAASTVRNNIALLMADAEPSAPVRGLRIAANDGEIFTQDGFEIISEKVNATQLSTNESQAVVHLPESVASSTRRISFVVFRNDRAFRSDMYSVNSKVLSINVENLTEFDNGEVIDIHLSPLLADLDRNQSRACAYWHFLDNNTGYWSQDGCTFIRSNQEGVLDMCRCEHLTHFAEVLVPRSVFSETNEIALEILTIIGCCLSIVGLMMIAVTAALFRSWRRDYSNKIWLQLCTAIFLLVTCFLVVVLLKFETYDIPCLLVGVILHYSLLASFCWMLVAAVLSYRRLVIVFSRDASHKLLRASAFAWGAPCAIVGILLSVAPHSYAGRFEEKVSTGSFCYPSGLSLWLAVYAPIAFMLIANWVLFALIVRSVFASKRIQRHGDANEALRCASVSCLLVFLFGLPWVFGLFAFNIVAAYLFTLTATFQGFVLFLFFVLGNKKTRDLWLNKLKIKQTRKVPVTSSTYTNRSTGAISRNAGASMIEANASKPRSLTSSDNSRFS